jgi:hypothetical protein
VERIGVRLGVVPHAIMLDIDEALRLHLSPVTQFRLRHRALAFALRSAVQASDGRAGTTPGWFKEWHERSQIGPGPRISGASASVRMSASGSVDPSVMPR